MLEELINLSVPKKDSFTHGEIVLMSLVGLQGQSVGIRQLYNLIFLFSESTKDNHPDFEFGRGGGYGPTSVIAMTTLKKLVQDGFALEYNTSTDWGSLLHYHCLTVKGQRAGEALLTAKWLRYVNDLGVWCMRLSFMDHVQGIMAYCNEHFPERFHYE